MKDIKTVLKAANDKKPAKKVDGDDDDQPTRSSAAKFLKSIKKAGKTDEKKDDK